MLRAHRNLAPELLESCGRLALGQCLCGRAAATGEVVFADSIDERHDIRYDGIHPHGHYCVPIKDRGEVLGVLNFYVPEGHVRNPDEERMLRTVADVLAGVIRRKHAEEEHLQAEERYRSVSESATDAIIAIDSYGNVISWNKGAEIMFGRDEGEMIGKPLLAVIPGRYRAGHEAGLRALREKTREPHLLGSMIELHGLRRNGDEFPLELSIGRWSVDDEVFYSGIIRDMTKRKEIEEQLRSARDGLEVRVEERTRELRDEIGERERVEQALRGQTLLVDLLHRAAVDANEAPDTDEAMRSCLAHICRYTGWPVGHVCVADRTDPSALVPSGVWHTEDPIRFAPLRRALEGACYSKGEGLPGRVLATGRPAWNTDLNRDVAFPAREEGAAVGLKSGFALPVLVRSDVVAVLQFFSDEDVVPDEPLLEAVGNIGTQLGRVVERRRAEEGTYLAAKVFENSLHGMIVTDPEGIIVSVNPAFSTMTGYSRDEAVGATPAILSSGRHDDAFYREMWQSLMDQAQKRRVLSGVAGDHRHSWHRRESQRLPGRLHRHHQASQGGGGPASGQGAGRRRQPCEIRFPVQHEP